MIYYKKSNLRLLSKILILLIFYAFFFSATPPKGSGLIPEFAPTRAVVLSQFLFDADYKAVELIRAIVESQAEVWIAVDSKLKQEKKIKKILEESGVSTQTLKHVKFIELIHSNIWLRDFGPIPAIKWNPGKGNFDQLFIDAHYKDPTSSHNDRVPTQMAHSLNTPLVQLPFELDGGNFMMSEEECFTSHMLDSNPYPDDFGKFFYKMGCKKFVDIDDAPHIHIDMWMKIVSNNVVFVHEITPQTIELASRYFGGTPLDLIKLRQNLDNKAEKLKSRFKVERLPLPLPFRNVFRTYTNALLVNGRAIIPRYRYFGWSKEEYPDSHLRIYYEEQVEKAFRRAGFSVSWVPGDGLIFNGGAFRCASFQIPDIKFFNKKGSESG